MGKNEDSPSAAATSSAGWGSFLKSLASFSGDLSSMSAPPFILSGQSLCEFPMHWVGLPSTFADISKDAATTSPEERARKVLKWFILTLKGQYDSRAISEGSEKKPLNPVLGETFFGSWPDIDGRGETKLFVEQVSHHPPITAYFVENADAGLRLEGHSGQKTSFGGGNVIVRQTGHAMLTVQLPSGQKESYLITLPRLKIEGIWKGSPATELSDSSFIISSTGYLSTISYSGAGWMSGKTHSFSAVLSNWNSSVAISKYSGQWHKLSYADKTDEVFTDATGEREEITVKPIAEQADNESRRLWEKVASGIKTSNYDFAAKEKISIENAQRQARKDEVASGKPFQLVYFTNLPDDDYTSLASCVKSIPTTEDKWAFRDPSAPEIQE